MKTASAAATTKAPVTNDQRADGDLSDIPRKASPAGRSVVLIRWGGRPTRRTRSPRDKAFPSPITMWTETIPESITGRCEISQLDGEGRCAATIDSQEETASETRYPVEVRGGRRLSRRNDPYPIKTATMALC
jgi:hypothetical protein